MSFNNLLKRIYTMMPFAYLLVILFITQTSGLDNGLAQTPPMGWLSWERFRCNTDCVTYPKSCINERLYMDMADRLAADGYREAGYEYVNIDDCWSEMKRDENMTLVPNQSRFPHGMKFLADYVHNKGLKLGIYGDMGTKTCAGYPGSKFTIEQDANTFAEWGIDSLKLDGCNSAISDFPYGYPIMEFFLNKTGRPILYSCSWPAYYPAQSQIPPYSQIADNCNIWRNYDDIQDSWDSVVGIIEYYGADKGSFSSVARPGAFNDPDMLIIGDTGLSLDQEKVQMAMWSIMAAPLFMSSDLRNIRNSSREILLNKGAISINQDKLGIMGKRRWKNNDIEGWSRPVLPKGSYAFTILNIGHFGDGQKVNFRLKDLGITGSGTYELTEVFTGERKGMYNASSTVDCYVDVASVFFGKLTLQ